MCQKPVKSISKTSLRQKWLGSGLQEHQKFMAVQVYRCIPIGEIQDDQILFSEIHVSSLLICDVCQSGCLCLCVTNFFHITTSPTIFLVFLRKLAHLPLCNETLEQIFKILLSQIFVDFLLFLFFCKSLVLQFFSMKLGTTDLCVHKTCVIFFFSKFCFKIFGEFFKFNTGTVSRTA